MLEYQRIEEFKIEADKHQAINRLLQDAFDNYPQRITYANQLPSFRYLVWDEHKLVAHMAVEYRMIKVGPSLRSILGIADLCVEKPYQHKHIASTLLQKLEALGKEAMIDFILLIAPDHGVYEKNEYKLVDNPCRWLIIHQQQSLGLGNRKLSDCLLVKQIGEHAWEEGLVDFMGHIF